VTGEDEIMTGEEPMFYSFELYVFIAFWFPASNVEITHPYFNKIHIRTSISQLGCTIEPDGSY
jgi:hypothetical protein